MTDHATDTRPRCQSDVTLGGGEHRHVQCGLWEGHDGAHTDGRGTTWTAPHATGSRAAIDPITEVVVNGVHPGDTGPCGETYATPDRPAKAIKAIQAERDLWTSKDLILNSNGLNYVAGLDFALKALQENP